MKYFIRPKPPTSMELTMQKYHCRVTLSNGLDRPLISDSEVEASRAAVAVKIAAESIPDRPKKGVWYHVAISRI